MIAQRARAVTTAYVVSDLGMTALAFFAAHRVRQVLSGIGDDWLGPVYPFAKYAPVLLLILPLWGAVFYAAGLYGRRSSRTLRTEIARLVRGIAIAALLFASAIFALKLTYLSRPVVLLFFLLDGLLIEAGRSLVRALVLDTSARRHVLVAGGRDEAVRTAESVNAHRDWGLRVVGLASDGGWSGTPSDPHPTLGTYDDIPSLVQQHVVDEVIFVPAAGSLDRVKSLEPIILRLEELGIVTRLLVNFLPRSLSEIALEEFGGMPMLTFSTAPRNELLLFVRRAADAALAAVLLALLSPVLALIALAIKATSRGPVLFRQTRCGLYGRPFTFLKFRSMRIDAEALKPALASMNEMDGPAFKMTNDPRVTGVGRFLRRTSLDELPQLWNILKGDMSFVGPRPAVVEEVAQYKPWQRRRLSMKPGLTCLWQISGRNELTFDEWMRLDLEYIDNWSLWLDVKIALKTIPAVLLGKGAK
jgi:exopolysaccharide biosynthesis polyprenyl glycosylphosphotransferase